jgi:hypothetical protein
MNSTPFVFRNDFARAVRFLLVLSVVFTFLGSESVAQHAPVKAVNTSAGSGDTQVWHLKREERSAPLTDWQTHQSRNFKMMSMLLPTGWQLEVKPGPNFATVDCADTSGRILVSATSPDSTMGLLVLPAEANMSSDSQAFLRRMQSVFQNFKGTFHCTIAPPETLANSLSQGAAKIAPGSHVVGQVEPVPGLSAEIPQIVAAANQRGGSHMTAEAGRLRLQGSFEGKQVEMWLVALATHRTEVVQGGTVTYSDLPLAALIYAPPGQLDKNDKLLMTLLSSLQIDPEWTRNAQYFVAALYQKISGAYAQVDKIHQQMAQDNANAAAQQAAIRNNTANYRSKVMSTVANNRSAALDHSSQQFALYMGDQAIYKDPSTGQRVQMSSGYDHVWASSTGNTDDYILTNSSSYDPNGRAGSSGWTQMQLEQ